MQFTVPHSVPCNTEWNQEKVFFGTNENIVPEEHFCLFHLEWHCNTMRGNTVPQNLNMAFRVTNEVIFSHYWDPYSTILFNIERMLFSQLNEIGTASFSTTSNTSNASLYISQSLCDTFYLPRLLFYCQKGKRHLTGCLAIGIWRDRTIS